MKLTIIKGEGVEPRQVAAKQGWQWIVQGFALFRKNPLIWVVLLAIYLVIAVLVSKISGVGPFLSLLLSPVFSAGFLLGASALDQGEELELAHLFGGFQKNTSQLITVGGLYMVGYAIVVGVMMMAGGGPIVSAIMLGGHQPDPTTITKEAMTGVMLGMLTGMVLLLPLMMAYWFAPALVLFDNMGPVEAMKQSLIACLRNWAPFLVYGVASFFLAMLATIPFGLGMIILAPTLTASVYASYRDIFAVADKVDQPDNPPEGED
jgi:uncharacterized membrane protein